MAVTGAEIKAKAPVIPRLDTRETRILKGLRLALASIEEAINTIEALSLSDTAGTGEPADIKCGIEKGLKWIRKIINKTRTNRLYPLKGDKFPLFLAGGAGLELDLECLVLPASLFKGERENRFFPFDLLNGYKQRISHNMEAVHLATLLFGPYQALYDKNQYTGQEREEMAALSLKELLAEAGKYCIRLTSSLFPNTGKKKYYDLFVFFLGHIWRLLKAFPFEPNAEEWPLLYKLLKQLEYTEYGPGAEQNLTALGHLCRKIVELPFAPIPGECVYG